MIVPAGRLSREHWLTAVAPNWVSMNWQLLWPCTLAGILLSKVLLSVFGPGAVPVPVTTPGVPEGAVGDSVGVAATGGGFGDALLAGATGTVRTDPKVV